MNTREIHWEITNKCNLKCKHCILDAGNELKDCMILDECLKAINIMRDSGVESICFTGGEPFCKSDFRTILEETIKCGIKTQVITNGTLVTNEWFDFLCINNILIGVSLDGYDKNTNDYIRGDGTFEKVCNLLSKCKESGLPSALYLTATRDVIEHLATIFKIAKDFNCINVHINDLTIDGRHKKDADYSMKIDKQTLIQKVNEASLSIFNEELTGFDKACWANGKCLFMTGNGNIYNCTEVKRLSENSLIGNIKTLPLKKWLDDNEMLDYSDCECCYHVYYNSCISLTVNKTVKCVLCNNNTVINSIDELYSAFDELNKECEKSCENCNYPDCKGYIWLTEQESKRLIENNIDVININNNIDLIYSFCNENGETNLNIKSPVCIHRAEDGKCKIYELRPLVCHMYPFGPDSVDGQPFWVMHKSCQFTDDLIKNNKLSEYLNKARKIIYSITPSLRNEIYNIYDYMNYLSSFPDGENNCIVVCEMRK